MRTVLRISAWTLAALAICAQTGVGQTTVVPAVQADIDTTYVLPDGRQFQVHGRYYRSHDGRVREDSERGATIADVKRGTLTILHSDTKEALVFKVPNGANRHEAKRASSPVPYGRGTHERYEVSRAKTKDAAGNEFEVWTAPAIGLIVYSRVESRGMTTTKTLRNFREAEPEATVFEVPPDYTVKHHTLPPFEFGALPPASDSSNGKQKQN